MQRFVDLSYCMTFGEESADEWRGGPSWCACSFAPMEPLDLRHFMSSPVAPLSASRDRARELSAQNGSTGATTLRPSGPVTPCYLAHTTRFITWATDM